MIPIQDLLHRIQWDPQFGHGDFVIGYYDRLARRVLRVPIKRVSLAPGERFALQILDEDSLAHSVPLHRVREVWRNGELIWRRGMEQAQ